MFAVRFFIVNMLFCSLRTAVQRCKKVQDNRQINRLIIKTSYRIRTINIFPEGNAKPIDGIANAGNLHHFMEATAKQENEKENIKGMNLSCF